MRIYILAQPFDANGNLTGLGFELNRQLASANFTQAYICSAFATSSGTNRLLAQLQAFSQRGGTVNVLVGLRNGLTSAQAIEDLLSLGAIVQGFHTGGSVLFHPKVYFLVGPTEGWLSIGSSNLTSEGLFRNFETNAIIELNLTQPADARLAQDITTWWNNLLRAFRPNVIRLTQHTISGLVRSGDLMDESQQLQRQLALARRARPGRGARPILVAAIPVPQAPPALRPVQPKRRGRVRRIPHAPPALAPRPRPTTRYFAMTLSGHDCSKRTGVPGTPEISLPEAAVQFFPPVARKQHMYPDAYFDVLLNSAQGAKLAEYRLWRRPGGLGAGHADLRINVKHDTIELTNADGGDIVLFERNITPTGPNYEVWIVHHGDPNYALMRARCTRQVAARGAAGIKYYGFF